jgi:hypothetical protein
MTATLLDLENFKKYIESLHDNIENSTSMVEDDWITLDQYIDISKNDLLKYNQLLNLPLYLFRPNDNYCYIMVHSEVESDFFAYLQKSTAIHDWNISSTPPLDKTKIGVRTDPLARFINNYKMLSVKSFKLNVAKLPTGFTLIGYHSILDGIANIKKYRPFLSVAELHTEADIIISEELFYKTTLLESCHLELLRYFKEARRSYTDMCVSKLDAATFFYATSRNMYIEENVYYKIIQDNTLMQSFEDKYSTRIYNYPKTYRKFAKTYFKEVF